MYRNVFTIILIWLTLALAAQAHAESQIFTPRQLAQYNECINISWGNGAAAAWECEALVYVVRGGGSD